MHMLFKKAGLLGMIGALMLTLTACGGLIQSLTGPSFPLPEPEYTNKRVRNFGPFEEALAGLTAERVSELDALLDGKTTLDMQMMMDEGAVSSEELVTYYVDRILRYDVDKLNSVMELAPDALDIARGFDAERANGGVRSPMHGIPVLLKDNIATGDGTHTTAGAYALRDWRADRDAFLVQRLREAGAVILGKANLSEWANYMDPSMPSGFSVLGGQTRHPYGPFDPLGSSSGSAVSVAADLTTVSVGTETQGSVIAPAKSSSVVAIKTSRGLVSRDHIVPLVDWMDVPGPMGRNVTDVAVLLTAISGVDEKDPAGADADALDGVDFTQYLDTDAAQGARVGILIWDDESVDNYLSTLQEQAPNITDEQLDLVGQSLVPQNDIMRALGSVFAEAGMEVIEVGAGRLPQMPDTAASLEYGFQDSVNRFLDGLGDAAPVSSLAEVAAFNEEDLANRAPYGQSFVTGSVNTTMAESEYQALVASGKQAAVELRALLEEENLDVLLINDMTQIYAPAGFPAITVPMGYADNGQPMGIVLMGDFLSEPKLIAAAYAFEQATQARRAPDLDSVIASFESLYNAPAVVE